jgi:hypothetical protein
MAKEARARRLAGPSVVQAPPETVPPDERNELTKKITPPPPAPTGALRLAFRAQFQLAVQAVDGGPVPPDAVGRLRQAVARLTDDAGPLWADAVYADELRRFRWDTGRCGLCGGLGHETTHESGDLGQ